MTILAIAVAGAIGSVLRYSLGRAVQRVAHVGFPVGTLAVNLIGCVAVGALTAHFMNDETHPALRAALVVGFCGGFTTFSTFSIETYGLIAAGNWPRASAYVVLSVACCLVGTAAGFRFVNSVHR